MSLQVEIQRQLQGFSLDVSFASEGGVLGILGASGCGKSMTLRCMAGIETPQSGRIVAGGRVLFDSAARINLPPQQRRVGYLFQSYALFPHMTVRENIACPLGHRPKTEQNKQVDNLLRRFQLEGLGKRYPGQISGGQQQRVALARILAQEPAVLLLDEPFSALDAYLKERLQLDLLDLLAEYAGDVVMVTHSRDEAYRLCDQLLVLEHGRCIASGATRELFRNPGWLAVARLTGCKNVSRIERRGEREVYAVDWGIVLQVAQPVSPEIDYIGVRAHDFRPAWDGAPNAFPITVQRQLESPFEWNVLVARRAGGGRLWWKAAKDVFSGIPDALCVDPEQVLLLRAGGGEQEGEGMAL